VEASVFRGGEWAASRAARHGVRRGWVALAALGGAAPRRVAFEGAVPRAECRAGRGTVRRMPITSLDAPVRLVELRNPWGRRAAEGMELARPEWAAEWSDSDDAAWAEHADVFAALGHFRDGHDGTWWMPVEEMERYGNLMLGSTDMAEFAPDELTATDPVPK